MSDFGTEERGIDARSSDIPELSVGGMFVWASLVGLTFWFIVGLAIWTVT